MKNLFVIASILTLLSACAGLQPQAPAPDAKVSDAAREQADADRSKQTAAALPAAVAEDPLPANELTDDLLFKILKSEIAFQRGQWQVAFITTLALAQQTRDPRLAQRAAEIAWSSKQPGEALPAVRLWRELAPKSEEASQYFLGTLLFSDKIDEAEPLFAQRLANAKPEVRGVLIFQIQRMLARVKDKAAAYSILDRLLAPYLSTLEAHIALAQGALVVEDFERGRKEASLALALKPDSELAAQSMLQSTPNKDDAEKFLASFLSKHPQANEVRSAYGRLLIDQMKFAKAQDEFQILLKAQPKNLTALFALGVLAMQTKDLKNADLYLSTYLKLLTSNPNDERDPTQALLMLAQIAEDRNDPDAALKWLDQIESGDALLGAQIKRAQIVAKQKDVGVARKMLSEIKAANEHDQVQIIIAEAQILRDANLPKEALPVLQAGLDRFPGNTDLLYDFAMVAEKLDRLDLMEDKLRKIIELTPTNQHAYNALGYSLAERSIRLPEAYALVEKALALAPEDPFIMDSMGWVQFRMGQLKEAEDFLRRAYALRSDPEIAVHLGEVLWVKGQKEAAQKLWRDVATKDPENDTLKSTLTRLHVHQ